MTTGINPNRNFSYIAFVDADGCVGVIPYNLNELPTITFA
jgi:hypothetical protein